MRVRMLELTKDPFQGVLPIVGEPRGVDAYRSDSTVALFV